MDKQYFPGPQLFRKQVGTTIVIAIIWLLSFCMGLLFKQSDGDMRMLQLSLLFLGIVALYIFFAIQTKRQRYYFAIDSSGIAVFNYGRRLRHIPWDDIEAIAFTKHSGIDAVAIKVFNDSRPLGFYSYAYYKTGYDLLIVESYANDGSSIIADIQNHFGQLT